MMSAILTHMVAITGHRDHLMLDTSVITALYDLIKPIQVRALEINRLREDLYMRPLVWIKEGEITTVDENLTTDQIGEPINNYPALVDCIQYRNSSARVTGTDGICMLWFPIWINDKVTTCLEITSTRPYAENAMHVITGILRVYTNFQNLLDYSERDSLTGLLNRKTFDEKFSRMVNSNQSESLSPNDNQERRHQTESKEQWLAVVDIDHFKRVNDQFGHLYGDEVLILIANLLRSSFRTQDRVFRFGGEEFVVLLRSTTLDETRKIFDRFRQNVEAYNFPQVGRVTVSLGFASLHGETPVVTLGHADQALYYAKTNGRNRLCHYDELVETGLLKVEVPQESVEFFFDDLPSV